MINSLKSGQTLYYNRKTGSDKLPIRARVNGKPQTWKRDPNAFRVPMKHGLRDTFQLIPANAQDWCLTEAEALATLQQIK